jgi:plasmid stabilization system protein ParE
MTRILFAPHAAFELADAAASYHATRPGLGRAFVEQVDHALSRIAYFPEIAPVVGGEFRRAVVYRFPFSIIYRVADGEIQVMGVLPTQADPERLILRLAGHSVG